MSKRPRRNHSPAFTAKVALAAVKGETTLAWPSWRSSMKRSGFSGGSLVWVMLPYRYLVWQYSSSPRLRRE